MSKLAKRTKVNTYLESIFQKKNKTHLMKPRNTDIYKVKRAKNKLYKDYSIPYMQKLLNRQEDKKKVR